MINFSTQTNYNVSYNSSFSFYADHAGGLNFSSTVEETVNYQANNTNNTTSLQVENRRGRNLSSNVGQQFSHLNHRDGMKHAMQMVERALHRSHEALTSSFNMAFQELQNSAVSQYAAIANEQPDAQDVADNVLAAITAKLDEVEASGGTTEDIEYYLTEGLKGFEQGVADAKEQLAASGNLDEEALEDINKTHDLVLSGIKDLREARVGSSVEEPNVGAIIAGSVQEALEEAETEPEPVIKALSEPEEVAPQAPAAPVTNKVVEPVVEEETTVAATEKETADTPEPAASQVNEPTTTAVPVSNTAVIQSTVSLEESIIDQLSSPFNNYGPSPLSSGNYGYGSLEEYSFQIKTRDGDTVTINFADTLAMAEQNQQMYALGADGFFEQNESATAFYQNTDFSFSVDGNLDDDETTAIKDLLMQVKDLAAEFFQGDPQKAFEKAMSMGYDAKEIAEYSLNMTKVEVMQVNNSYAQIAQLDPTTGEASPVLANQANPFLALGDYVKELVMAAEKAATFEASPDLLTDTMRSVERFSSMQLVRNGEHSVAGFTRFNSELLGALAG